MTIIELIVSFLTPVLLVVGTIRHLKQKKQARERERAMNQPRPCQMNKTEF